MKKQDNCITVLLLMSIGLMASSGLLENSVSAESGMFLEATSERDSTEISLTGKTSKSDDVTITVTAPNGNIIFIDQLKPSPKGEFETKINTMGLLWTQGGLYSIAAQQSDNLIYQLDVKVEVIDGKVKTTSVSDSSLVDQGIVAGPSSDERGLTIFAEVIPGSTTIPLSGHTTSLIQDITITVTAPNGNIISVDQIRPGINGDFETEIHTGSDLWKQDGFYTIVAQQGQSSQFKESTEIEIIDRAVIPEFGTIAVVILAVAIVSIIAVSSRSRLSIVPRY